MAEQQNRDTELILPPGVFAYVLDQTKGKINTLTGPIKTSLSNTDQLVTYNPDTKRFVPSSQPAAVQTNIIAPKGHYVIMDNPCDKQPTPSGQHDSFILQMGQIENIPGPVSFALWPGQKATVVRGHHLRSNQYLLVRVYDDEAAKANWDKSVVKSVLTDTSPPANAGGVTEDVKDIKDTKPQERQQNVLTIKKEDLVTGQLLIIKGTEVAFYIPATGIEVLREEETNEYVRDAVTLERLEYSILLDENGNKEYVKGPAVVFPLPTQTFVTSKTDDNKRKFRAFELQEKSGLHIKVIADYIEGAVTHIAGEELFITGSDQAIYYPRPEHAIISYGNQEKYYAIAIPGGEGRYVLNRRTGVIALVHGPAMFLPNPINEVPLRRILSDNECKLYYPGNDEVLTVNKELRIESGQDYSLGNTQTPAPGEGTVSLDYERGLESLGAVRSRSLRGLPISASESSAKGLIADAMTRGTKYTPPRTITINSKYEGAVRIEVYAGYAIQVVNSKGDRRTVVGPQTTLLEYDEKLERLSLSKGKPKSSDNRIDTVYLKHISNPVSDIIVLKTQDLVNVKVQVKYLVRFDEAQKDKWFAVDNYVQYMVDHLRSLIGNKIRSIGVQEFYQSATNILRDIVLGERVSAKDTDGRDIGSRSLHHFNENGMTVYDLELIAVEVMDGDVASLLSTSRQEILRDSIELDRQTQKFVLTKGKEQAKRATESELADTLKIIDNLSEEKIGRQHGLVMATITAESGQELARERGKETVAKINIATQALYRDNRKEDKDLDQIYAEAELDRKIKLLVEEAASSKTRMESVQPALVEALIAASNAGILEKVTPQLAALAFVNGNDLETTIETMLKGTGAEGILANLRNLTRSRSLAAGKRSE